MPPGMVTGQTTRCRPGVTSGRQARHGTVPGSVQRPVGPLTVYDGHTSPFYSRRPVHNGIRSTEMIAYLHSPPNKTSWCEVRMLIAMLTV